MRITIVSGFFLPLPPVAGGAMEKIWWRLAQEFNQAGHEVTVVTRSWPGASEDGLIDGIQVRRARGFPQHARLGVNLMRDLVWSWRVQRRLPAADILVTNTVALPVWVARRRPDAGRLVVNLNRYPKGQLRWYRDVARIQAASRVIADAAAAQAPRWRHRIQVTPNPIDWRLFAAAAAARRPDPTLRIGYQGRIHPEKGLELLIDAARHLLAEPALPPWSLHLRGAVDPARGGGGMAYVAHLRARAAPLVATGRFLLEAPEYDPAKLAAACAAMDVTCYPTRAEKGEALPVAVLEAMAAARPVVVTALACFNDVIESGVTGELLSGWASPDASLRLAGLLGGLLRDPGRRARLGRAAQVRVRAFDFPDVAAAMLADFAGLLHAPA